jgi:crotonobetainyl-CoA:carnitine CoA-transferase CaiB-like acyl-CoA transferase
VENRSELVALLNAPTMQRTTAEWVQRLETAGVPCGPINALDALFRDPQIVARGMRVELPHPVAGTVPGVANPIRLSETPITYRNAPPPLGAHTDEVLQRRLGVAHRDIGALRAKGIV